MAFKMKDPSMHMGTARHTEAMTSYKKTAYKKSTYADALEKDPKLGEYVKLQKTLKKGSPEWNKNQNKINKAYGDSTRHDEGGASSGKASSGSGSGSTTSRNTKSTSLSGAAERNRSKTVELDELSLIHI